MHALGRSAGKTSKKSMNELTEINEAIYKWRKAGTTRECLKDAVRTVVPALDARVRRMDCVIYLVLQRGK